jgi:NAD-dependent dihydropyrimidine dehydrogenase PreA subunit
VIQVTAPGARREQDRPREVRAMAYVIAEPCIGVKDRACVDVCPVNCIYEGEDQLYIHPDECIDCGACEPVCPVKAIFPAEDVPPQWAAWVAKNAEFFTTHADARPAAGKAAG